MDSNGTRYVLYNQRRDFRTGSQLCGWNDAQSAFTLTRRDEPRLPEADAALSEALSADALPYMLDDHGQLGRISVDRSRLEFALRWPEPDWRPVMASRVMDDDIVPDLESLVLDPVDAPPGTQFSELQLGGDGLVTVAYSDDDTVHGLLLVHLRRRWQQQLALPFKAVSLWVDEQNQIWLAGEHQLGLCRGQPLIHSYATDPARFEPAVVNPDPPRLIWQQPLPAHRRMVAMAGDGERLVMLVDSSDPDPSQVLLVRELNSQADLPIKRFALPKALPSALDICCPAIARVILLSPFKKTDIKRSRTDCIVLDLKERKIRGRLRRRAVIATERWPRPMRAHYSRLEIDEVHELMLNSSRFISHRDQAPRLLMPDGPTQLYPLAQAHYAHEAKARLNRPLDAGAPDIVWNRIYIDACIPSGCTIEVDAFAANDPKPAPLVWQRQPSPQWQPIESELPYLKAKIEPVSGRAGLFEVLLQRANGTVRELRGRYLQLRLRFSGDGRHSPAIYALRAWYPRFSWQQHYLPPHFQQEAEADPIGLGKTPVAPANGADLRERLLASLEGSFTPIEERIAAAETLLHPQGAPTQVLPSLSAMMGRQLPPHWPEQRQRDWLIHSAYMQRHHGTYAGICRALNILTDGAVRRGQVIPVEHFRLRRTMATILGIDMDDAQHPLTLGTRQSGNSRVGQTLILSDENSREFLALFAPELAERLGEQETIERFFANAAQQITVVLHGPAKQLRRVVEETLPSLVPAVVQWAVRETEHPFVLGLSPLLQIDTYIEPQPPTRPVRLNHSRLNGGDLIKNPVALSPEHAVRV